MKRLPELEKPTETPSWQTERLSRWFVEWQIEWILKETEIEDDEIRDAGDVPDPAVLVEELQPGIATGQIRLLAPRSAATSVRLLYMAVIDSPRADQYLCIPFGRFSEPAFPGEWKTAREAMALRVLCVWNACVLPESVLARAWVVGELNEDEARAVSAVRANIDSGHGLPPAVEQATGAPMIHPVDPRWEYWDEEILWMASLLGDAERAFIVRDSHASSAWSEDNRELLLAAEGRARYGRVHHYNIVGYALSLIVTENLEARSIRVDVVDASGDPSRRLDGGYLLGVEAGRSVPIWMGSTWCDKSLLDRGFILFDDRGLPMPTALAE